MASSDTILGHIGDVSVIVILSIVYVALLSVGTVGRHVRTLVVSSMSSVGDTLLRVKSRTPLA